MINDNENQEALELKPMINNDTQNDAESFTEEAALVDNALENEVFVGGLRREERLYRQCWPFVWQIPKSRRFCVTLFLVLTVSTSAVVLVSHYTGQNKNEIVAKSQGKVFILFLVEKSLANINCLFACLSTGSKKTSILVDDYC
jgi:hypothetical protein